jgi:hypothetical protein
MPNIIPKLTSLLFEEKYPFLHSAEDEILMNIEAIEDAFADIIDNFERTPENAQSVYAASNTIYFLAKLPSPESNPIISLYHRIQNIHKKYNDISFLNGLVIITEDLISWTKDLVTACENYHKDIKEAYPPYQVYTRRMKQQAINAYEYALNIKKAEGILSNELMAHVEAAQELENEYDDYIENVLGH